MNRDVDTQGQPDASRGGARRLLAGAALLGLFLASATTVLAQGYFRGTWRGRSQSGHDIRVDIGECNGATCAEGRTTYSHWSGVCTGNDGRISCSVRGRRNADNVAYAGTHTFTRDGSTIVYGYNTTADDGHRVTGSVRLHR
ncbi:MAG: hypothetical protein KC619_17290 [Myxococcales bacterium]|nr:hypothetical protein [Myxococcales bacterium]